MFASESARLSSSGKGDEARAAMFGFGGMRVSPEGVPDTTGGSDPGDAGCAVAKGQRCRTAATARLTKQHPRRLWTWLCILTVKSQVLDV